MINSVAAGEIRGEVVYSAGAETMLGGRNPFSHVPQALVGTQILEGKHGDIIFIVLGKNEDAVEVLKTTDFADAPLQLAIAYMRLGRQADAKAAVEKMLKSAPDATMQSWRQTWNFRDPSILDQAAADLARAGLPGSPTHASHPVQPSPTPRREGQQRVS